MVQCLVYSIALWMHLDLLCYCLEQPLRFFLLFQLPACIITEFIHGGRQTIKHFLGNQQVTILFRNKMLLLLFNIIIAFIFFILISNLEILKNRKILGRKLKLTYSSNFPCSCIDNWMEDAKQ